MELGPAFSSLDPIKQKINFVNGLQHPGNVVGGHARGAAGILTGVQPKGGREIRAETSFDQILARRLGDATVLPSLVLACERPVSGFHESGYSMMYSSHVSWSSPVSPVPFGTVPVAGLRQFIRKQRQPHATQRTGSRARAIAGCHAKGVDFRPREDPRNTLRPSARSNSGW